MPKKSIGEFEEIVLLIVTILNGSAYSISIINEIHERLGRKVSLGAIQTVLKRLEGKQLLQSDFGVATKARGGKRKRLYKITPNGQRVLTEIRAQRSALWDAIPKLPFNLA